MSTPKINFFIQAGHRADLHRALPGSRGFYEQLFGLAHRAAPGHGILPGGRRCCRGRSGEQVMNYRGCPDPSAPIPNNCSRCPLGKSRSSKGDAAAPSSSCTPQQPDGIITRTILRLNPDPAAGDPDAPDYPEHFPMEGASPTPQSKPAIPLGFRYPLLLGFVRLLWEFLLV